MKMRMLVAAVALGLTAAAAGAAPAPDSKRMERAKDFIADEQWARAIVELQAAAEDAKEPNRDEALFWLAHSQHQAGDDSSALQAIARLERAHATSRWVRPARSLRVEIAQRLGRSDLLWRMITPPPPAPAPAPVAPGPPVRPGTTPAVMAVPSGMPAPVPPTPPARALPAATTMPPPAPAHRGPGEGGTAPSPTPPPPATPPSAAPPMLPTMAPRRLPAPPQPPLPSPPMEYWLPPTPAAAGSVKIEVLSVLLESHEDRVIPLLREIALDSSSPEDARRATTVLGQSRRPEAHTAVMEVARRGVEPARVAAIRELGRFAGPGISGELMQVYAISPTLRVKRQVVTSLGDRADNVLLLRIVRSEQEPAVRDFAIFTLGRAGARDQLRTLYAQTPQVSRPAVLSALFTVKDEDELIRIARTEKDPLLRARARQTLGMLATPKALKFLEENP